MRLPTLENAITPALVVDGAVLRDNVVGMATRADALGVELWPHAKTHKSLRIAGLQRARGAAGLTVSTLHEAERFADVGFDALLLAQPPVGRWRLEALPRLASRASLRVVVDGLETVALLDEACRRAGSSIRYLWEVDCGVHRCGTAPGAVTARLVAEATRSFGAALFDGLMTFGGHAYAAADEAGVEAAAADERDALGDTAQALAALGIETAVRSAGTTPTAHALADAGPITEIRPGNYVFYDATQVALGVVSADRCALSVLATVLARPDPRRLILDSGSKALAAERLTARSRGFGLVAGHPELTVERLYEEHAVVTSPEPIQLPLGSRLRVVPNHACTTVNLHERMLVVESGEVVDVWPVDARGWTRG
ncbi:MAG TPA: alanine racemase [Gaiellaceae bacterium]|nr:alanine racemase [Gaiellaceae bacterium]